MAARQLAEVVRLHPDEADTILQHLHPLLRSRQWETRMAAVDAIEEVMRTHKFSARGREQTARKEDEIETTQSTLKLDTFDLESVLQSSGEMGASGGEEFDFTTTLQPPHSEEMQKRELNERLGFDFSTKFGGISTDELFTFDETQALPAASTTTAPMSARERNQMKRALTKRKRAASEAASLEVKKSKTVPPSRRYLADRSRMDSGVWPLRDFCAILKGDLFDEAWEVRHGAATAIRAIVRLQGSGAGAMVGMDSSQVAASRSLWLQDMALNLVVVIAKDRFGDFRSDEVVAPVRESSSQALVSCFFFHQILT